MIASPHRLALFNRWANEHLHATCAKLDDDELKRDRGAFFRSVLGTLNHILLVDILYRDRIEGRPSTFKSLDEQLHDNLADLVSHQIEEDQRWIALTKDIATDDLEKTIGFDTLMDRPDHWEVPMHIYFTNLAQHQVHHRGQVHCLLSQAKADPPSIGYIEYRVATDGSFVSAPRSA